MSSVGISATVGCSGLSRVTGINAAVQAHLACSSPILCPFWLAVLVAPGGYGFEANAWERFRLDLLVQCRMVSLSADANLDWDLDFRTWPEFSV